MVNNSLPKGWRWVTLSDIAAKNYGLIDGPFGSNLPASEYIGYGIPVIRGSNLTSGDGFFNSDEFVYISPETAQRLSRSLAYPDDIIFTKKGTLGQTGFVPHDPRFEKYLTSSNQMKLTVDRDTASPLFVYYYVSSTESREKIKRDSESTGVPKTNLEYLRTFPISLPPLHTQHAIARILGSLDNKIELNLQMNETLEAMARTIFQSWFVVFDPVRAKAEGRDTGLPPEVAALFPDGFEEVAGREVPKGWGIESLGNVIEMTTGKSYTSDELQESTTALVTLKSFQRGGGYRQDGLKPFIGKYKPEQVIRPGELVISFTDVTQAAEVIGKPAIVSANLEFQTLVASLDVGIIRPKNERINVSFLYLLLRNDDYQSFIYGYCSGTTVLHLNKLGVPKYEFICPDPEIMKIFFNISKPIFDEIENNIQQSSTLAQIRDALLPKLMSGEISISGCDIISNEGT